MSPLPEAFDLRLEMRSDWHVGTGEGEPGGIDRLIARDPAGLPYIPAKTLTGIWRDACETVVEALDEGLSGPWHAWLDWIFGSQPARVSGGSPAHERAPVPAALSIRSAHLLPQLRAALRGGGAQRELLRRELSIVKPSVAIDAASGRAKDKQLRFDEMARKGMTLRAACQLGAVEDTVPREASVLLLAGLSLVERMGGKRRRGAGRCRWQVGGLDEDDLERAWTWLEACASPAAPPVPISSRPAITSLVGLESAAAEAGDWFDVVLDVALKQPLLVSSRVLGNTVESLDFVPGASLMVPLANRLRAIGFDAWPSIVSGRLRILPAYVDVQEARGLPVPLCLGGSKLGAALPDCGEAAAPGDRGWIVNRMVETPASDAGPMRPFRNGYVGAVEDRVPWYRQTPLEGRTHSTIEDVTQRPTAAVGGVYSYRAIATGTQLRSVLRLHPDVSRKLADLDARWWERLRFSTSLGRSRKDDYGSVRIEAAAPRAVPPAELPGDGVLRVWLLSDTLIRDPETLRPDPTPDGLARHIGNRIGVGLKPGRSFVRRRRIDSWHARWGQPRPSLMAIQAGSCVELRACGDEASIDMKALRNLVAEGLGERRGEGFGDVQIGGPLLDDALSGRPWPEPPSAQGADAADEAGFNRIGQDSPSWSLARDIETSAWRAAIRRSALARAASADFRKRALGFTSTKPPASQLGALRDAVGQRAGPDGQDWARAWLEALRRVDGRKAKWPPGALDCVQRLLSEPNLVWELLEGDDYPVLTSDGATALETELWMDAVETVVDACVRAQLRERGD